jgi:aryl-alcohol dehydrogenase-like predicted oxidoreductase
MQAGLLDRLKQAGIEIHARSAFLQGLLLLPPAQLPEHFSAIHMHHARLHHQISETGLTPLEASLRFCLGQAHIDQVIVGCETAKQFNEILRAAERDGAHLPAPESYSISDESIINPSLWPK